MHKIFLIILFLICSITTNAENINIKNIEADIIFFTKILLQAS